MPPNEQTPLIQTVIIATPRPRYTHSTIRRFCTVALGATLVIIIILFLIPGRWLPGNHSESEWAPLHHPWDHWPEKAGLSFEDLQKLLLDTPKEEKARQWSQYYTAGPHLAGKNLSQAIWTRERWQDFGVESSIVDYDVYIDYPVGHRLALLEKKDKSNSGAAEQAKWEEIEGDQYKIKYECSLEEDVLDADPTTGLDNRIPTFHGYSASGNATARYVYVNFGTYDDFEDLVKLNVTLKGNIALVKYGRIFRGLKVKRAQELGMIGVVIYTDPQEDGEITEENGYKTYPRGPARNPSSVQRGSVQYISVAPGDPTTPGYPSKPGAPRVDPHHATPTIPSLPISYKDAIPLLKDLNGHGPKAAAFNEYWQGGGLGYKGVEYYIGPSPPGVVLNLVNEQEYITTPLWNVIGIINGTIQDEVIVLGNHRDAWIAGGAGDPNSGSACLNEVVRSFGLALAQGWKPLRTIVFASWDGEEYGLIGSTEWVEEYIPWLSSSVIAYLNLDVGTRGPIFEVVASPLLNKALYHTTSLVQSPNQTVPGQTVRDLWDGRIRTMGSGSDFTAFQDFAGIPSVDLGFASGPNSPVYHYHSNYDSFAWMDKFGDEGWHYHIAITRVIALLAASLVENPIVTLNATDYATGLQTYLQSIKHFNNSSSLHSLNSSIYRLHNVSTLFDAKAADLASTINTGVPWWRWWRKAQLYFQVRQVNGRYKLFERQFLYEEGLDGRSWYKHVVFAPGMWTGYAGATFPGLVESGTNGDREGFERWCNIIEEKVDAATKLLES